MLIAVRQGVDGHLELFLCLAVVAVAHLQLSQIKVCERVVLLVADGILISGDGFAGEMDATVALCHLHRPLTFLFPFLVGGVGVGLPVLCGSIEVFAEGIEFVALLHGLICPTTDKQQGADNAIYDNANLSHTLLKRKNKRFISSGI